jgi:hypothetical protein
MSLIDAVTTHDGKKFTVSTARKFDTWETAVFEGGSLNVMFGRNVRFVEVTLGDHMDVAQLTHRQVVVLVQNLDSAGWTMSKSDMRREQSRAADYVTSRIKLADGAPSRSLEVMKASVQDAGLGEVLAFGDSLAHLSIYDWQRVLRVAEMDRSWMDPQHHAVAGPVVEASGAAIVAGAVVALIAGQAIARAGLSMDANQMLVFVCGTAAMALAARDVLTPGAFAAMYRPFADVVPLQNVRRGSA